MAAESSPWASPGRENTPRAGHPHGSVGHPEGHCRDTARSWDFPSLCLPSSPNRCRGWLRAQRGLVPLGTAPVSSIPPSWDSPSCVSELSSRKKGCRDPGMFIHGHLMGQGVKAGEDGLSRTCSAPAGPSSAPTTHFVGDVTSSRGCSTQSPPGEVPKQELCPVPSPWLALGPCPVPGGACSGSMESPVPGQSRAARCCLPVSWPGRGGRNKTPPFPPFQRERAATFDTGSSSGRAQCPSPCLPALCHALLHFFVPSCPPLAGISLGNSSWELGPLH